MRNHVCIHTRLLHVIAHTFGWGVGGDNVSVHLLTSSMLRSTRLLYLISHSFAWGGGVANRSLPSQACGWSLPGKWEDKIVARSQLARKLRTNAGIPVKISFQTVSIQRMRRTSECWDLEPCLPMALAIQSSPCLAANGFQGSQRTSNEMLHLQVAKVKRAECPRSGGIPCSHLLIVIGDMPTFAIPIMPFKWIPHNGWNTSHANSSGMFRRYHRTAMKLTRHSPAVICGFCPQCFLLHRHFCWWTPNQKSGIALQWGIRSGSIAVGLLPAMPRTC